MVWIFQDLLQLARATSLTPNVQNVRRRSGEVRVELKTPPLVDMRSQSLHRQEEHIAMIAHRLSIQAVPAFVPDRANQSVFPLQVKVQFLRGSASLATDFAPQGFSTGVWHASGRLGTMNNQQCHLEPDVAGVRGEESHTAC